jgi:hypothetical protein
MRNCFEWEHWSLPLQKITGSAAGVEKVWGGAQVVLQPDPTLRPDNKQINQAKEGVGNFRLSLAIGLIFLSLRPFFICHSRL